MVELNEQQQRFQAVFRDAYEQNGLPPDMRDGIELYVLHGCRPGGFLSAVLRNDLTEAAGRADEINQPLLFQWAKLCYQHLPLSCWGSREKITAWIEQGGLS